MKPNNSVEILGVKILKNQLKINENFPVQILFEIKVALKEKLEIKFVYVQSPGDINKDQELGIYEIPGDKKGKFKVNFLLNTPSLYFPESLDSFGITLLLIQFSYNKIEFTRVGYYVNNYLKGPIERDSEAKIFIKTSLIQRSILIDEPRVTKFSTTLI